MMRTTVSRRQIAALCAATLLSACHQNGDEAPPPVRPVLSLVVEPRAAQPFGPFTGVVEPRYETKMGFRAAGRMISRDADVGSIVAKGQLLASLDPTEARLALASASADVTAARVHSENAGTTLDRKATLLKTDSTPQSQVDSAKASKDTADASLNEKLSAYAKAKEQLGYTRLESEFDGVVTAWSAEVGQVVSTGQTVVTVARPDARDAVFDVPDESIGDTKVGTVFTLSLLSSPGITTSGTAREVAPQADEATRTRRVKLTLDQPPDAFRLGTTATITLARRGPPIIEVPSTAILERDGRTSVWLVTADNKAQLRSVQLGTREPSFATVTSGLAKGDRVIVAGVHSLSEGEPVKLSEQGS